MPRSCGLTTKWVGWQMGGANASSPLDSPQEAPLHDMHRGGASVCAEQLGGVIACGSGSLRSFS